MAPRLKRQNSVAGSYIQKSGKEQPSLDARPEGGHSKLVRRYAAVRDYTCVVKALLGQGVAFNKKSDAGCRSQGRKIAAFPDAKL
jgi:hypothetical protein